MFVDTLIAYVDLPQALDVSLFHSASVTWSNGQRITRYWRNSTVGYEPRITYWRRGAWAAREDGDNSELPEDFSDGALRIEWSLRKMSLDAAASWLRSTFGELPALATWNVIRIDYCYDWRITNANEYLTVFRALRLAGQSAQQYPSGVSWATASRAVKFYDKSLEQGGQGGLLRFEVSNYRDAVRYMAAHWFAGRSVADLVTDACAIRTLLWAWSRLGLEDSRSYDAAPTLLPRVAAAFGTQADAAWYVLHLVSQYGSSAVRAGLISNTKYYKYKSLLCEHGFLISDDSVVMRALPALSLPSLSSINSVESAQNLDVSGDARRGKGEKIALENMPFGQVREGE